LLKKVKKKTSTKTKNKKEKQKQTKTTTQEQHQNDSLNVEKLFPICTMYFEFSFSLGNNLFNFNIVFMPPPLKVGV